MTKRFHVIKESHYWKEYYLSFTPANTGDPERDKKLDALTIEDYIEGEEDTNDYEDGGNYPDDGDLTIVEVNEDDTPLPDVKEREL